MRISALYFGATYLLFFRKRRTVRLWLVDSSSDDCRRYDIMAQAAWERRPRCLAVETLHQTLSDKQLARLRSLYPLHKTIFYHGYCTTHFH